MRSNTHRTKSNTTSRRTIATVMGIAFVVLAGPLAKATDYYIDPSGLGGLGNGTRTFTTPQAAFAAIPAGTAVNPTRVLVSPGTYTGQVLVNKNFVDVIGLGSDNSKTVFTDNLTTTIANATFTVTASHFTASNVTFANSTPNGDGSDGHAVGRPTVQALAIASMGDENAFQNCSFTGLQDTLYNATGRYYYNNCTITGITDFMYGDATAVFNNSSIVCPPVVGGFLTAARTSANKPVGFVIMNSTITGFGTNQDTFGRPWGYATGSYPNVMLLNDKIGPMLKTSGANALWDNWDHTLNTNLAGDSRYATFGLTDLSGKSLALPSEPYSHPLSTADAAQLTLNNIFGPVSNFSFSHWGVGASTIWGPVNAVNTSNVTTAVTATSFTNYTLGGTWDPTIQLNTISVPEPGSLLILSGAFLLCFRQRKFTSSISQR